MLPKSEQFIRERQYLHNVSPATLSWHTHNLKWIVSRWPTEDELKQMVVRMRAVRELMNGWAGFKDTGEGMLAAWNEGVSVLREARMYGLSPSEGRQHLGRIPA